MVGVWDAEVEVWPNGLGEDPIKFKGVETNEAFGDHWLSSDFVSEVQGQTTKVHSIVGYDLDQGKLVGKVIDQGPYAASMIGEYHQESKTIEWITQVKAPDGTAIVQKTEVTQKNADERVLVLSVPNKGTEGFTKFMQIRFVRRK